MEILVLGEAVFAQQTCFHIALVQPSESLMKLSLDTTMTCLFIMITYCLEYCILMVLD